VRVAWLDHVCVIPLYHVCAHVCAAPRSLYWLVHVCVIPLYHVCAHVCATPLYHVCATPRSYEGHAFFIYPFKCVTGIVHVRDMPHSNVWHAPFMCVTCLIDISVTCLIRMSHMTHSYV